ncbi:MAG TPA: type III pantothenate kinase [Dehalococcoidia bacterium]|nr:type III pantothenate kinase [Dehalococcoidia bacterium]
MLLAVDIGNTTIALGLFEDDRLRCNWRFKTDVERTADEYAVLLLSLLREERLSLDAVTDAVVASVVPSLIATFQEICRRYFGLRPLVVDIGTRTGLRIIYDNPRDVGADRVVDAVAAIKLYGPPLIVVDFGTATVFDAINREGDYVGGAIAPGISISAEALFQRTAKLPRVEMERPRTAIGRNTTAAMQSGIIFGYVGLIEGLVARFKEELGGEARVIGTGGWAHLVAKETPAIDVVNPNLTLLGLRIIYDLNRGEGPQARAGRV